MLKGFIRLLMEIVDLVASKIPSYVSQFPVSTDESVPNPVLLDFPITIQPVQELFDARSATGIDRRDVIVMFLLVRVVLPVLGVSINASLDIFQEPFHIFSRCSPKRLDYLVTIHEGHSGV